MSTDLTRTHLLQAHEDYVRKANLIDKLLYELDKENIPCPQLEQRAERFRYMASTVRQYLGTVSHTQTR